MDINYKEQNISIDNKVLTLRFVLPDDYIVELYDILKDKVITRGEPEIGIYKNEISIMLPWELEEDSDS